MIDGHPIEYMHGQHGQDTSDWYCPPLSSPLQRQSALVALEGPTTKATPTSSVSPISSTSSTPSITTACPATSPTTPRGALTIPTLGPSASTPTSPQSQSQSQSNSSSPSTTAFVTPASSLSERSQHPSIPPSPDLRSSHSQSTLAAALAALYPQSTTNTNTISSITPISTRPAPPSPRLTISTRGSGNLSLSRPVSRPVSGLVLFPDVKAEGEESLGATDDEGAGALSSTTEKALPAFVPFSSPVSASVIKPYLPRPVIVIRDYAFEADDDRYHGLGPFVPKWNKVERLMRVLVEAARDDEEARERRRRRKERKERKRCERAKRRRRRKGVGNEWSGSESEDANDNGWASSDSGSRRTSDESGDDDSESCDDHHHNPYYQGEADYRDYPDMEEYSEDIPSGPLLPGLYRALYGFEPEGEAEMGLEEGQFVRVVGRGGGVGWAVVVDESLGLGGHALVPESYLEVVRLDGGEEDE